jgi:hypothetical protein
VNKLHGRSSMTYLQSSEPGRWKLTQATSARQFHPELSDKMKSICSSKMRRRWRRLGVYLPYIGTTWKSYRYYRLLQIVLFINVRTIP